MINDFSFLFEEKKDDKKNSDKSNNDVKENDNKEIWIKFHYVKNA